MKAFLLLYLALLFNYIFSLPKEECIDLYLQCCNRCNDVGKETPKFFYYCINNCHYSILEGECKKEKNTTQN